MHLFSLIFEHELEDVIAWIYVDTSLWEIHLVPSVRFARPQSIGLSGLWNVEQDPGKASGGQG